MSLKPRQVILIHGIFDSSKKMKWLAAYLQAKGFRVHLYELKPNDASVSMHYLAKELAVYLEKNGITQCDIVAYSMGGVVARLFIQEYEGYKKIQKCVTISTPHQGTLVANLAYSKGVSEMRWKSPLTLGFKKFDHTCAQTKWLSVRTPFDLVIIPSSSSIISFGENKSFAVLAHPLMVRNRRVAEYISNFLAHA